MNKSTGCEYCIPNDQNETKTLMTIQSFSTYGENGKREKHTVDQTRIERDLRHSWSLDKETFILATHRKTHITENKEQILPTFEEKLLAINIKACPKCGRMLENE